LSPDPILSNSIVKVAIKLLRAIFVRKQCEQFILKTPKRAQVLDFLLGGATPLIITMFKW